MKRVTETKKAAFATQIWGEQTISFAISVRGADTNKSVENEAVFNSADRIAEEKAKELWESSERECGPNPPLPTVTIKFARKVFQWCYEYLNP